MKKTISVLLVMFLGCGMVQSQKQTQIALLKYHGGGDWYGNPTSLTNLIAFFNEQTGAGLNKDYATVEAAGKELFNYPFIHMTGHGNVVFDEEEVRNLRTYLMGGGFLHIDDNYGLDPFVRREMKRVFPDLEFVELPRNHEIYHRTFDFPNGLPKIHEHDAKPAQGFALFWEGRMICFYTHECDLGDGWEDAEIHNDPPEKRLEALRMGCNILDFVFEQ